MARRIGRGLANSPVIVGPGRASVTGGVVIQIVPAQFQFTAIPVSSSAAAAVIQIDPAVFRLTSVAVSASLQVVAPAVAGYLAEDERLGNPFTYLVCNLYTGQVIDELPLSTYEYTRARNRPGGWDATISYRHSSIADRPHLLAPWTCAVYVARGDVILNGGILMHRESTQDGMFRIGGEGFFAAFREGRRKINSRAGMAVATGENNYKIDFAQVEQFEIVRDLFRHAVAYGGEANIDWEGIDAHGPAAGGNSGILRDRTFWSYEDKGIGDEIEQMAGVQNGFDFSESYEWTASSVIGRRFHLWFPRKGVDSPLTFELGRNVVILRRNEDGSHTATRATSIGSGQADAALRFTAVDTASEYPMGAYPILETTNVYPDVSVPETLVDHAVRDLATARAPLDTIELQVVEQIDAAVGSFDTGDSVSVIAMDGGLQVLETYRIETFTVSIDVNGAVLLKPTVATFAASAGV